VDGYALSLTSGIVGRNSMAHWTLYEVYSPHRADNCNDSKKTPTVEKRERKQLQGINHTDSSTFSKNSTNTTFDGGNGHCITNIINEVQGINVISNHIKRQ